MVKHSQPVVTVEFLCFVLCPNTSETKLSGWPPLSRRAVVSGPDGRGPSLFPPQDIWAVHPGGGHSQAREAHETEESPKTSVMTISFFPVSAFPDPNRGVRANRRWAEDSAPSTLFFPVPLYNRLLVRSHIYFLPNMVDLSAIAFLTWVFCLSNSICWHKIHLYLVHIYIYYSNMSP